MTKANIARSYLDKYPDFPNLKLARIVYEENKLQFKNVEDARSTIRRMQGKCGKDRSRITHPSEHKPYNPYKLPDSDANDYEPYILTGCKRALVVADIHAPFHDIEALSIAIDYAKKDKVDTVIIDGDMFDFHGLSRFIKDPKKKNFSQELAIGVSIMETLERVLNARVIFKLGNHDERYEHFLWMKAAELKGIEEIEFENIIKKRLPNVTVVKDKRIIKAGALNILHGHEFTGGVHSPVNVARGLYIKAKSNSLCGHHHQTSEHTEPDIDGHLVKTWSLGCLCELHPHYMPINRWGHGFAIVDIDGKDFEVRNKSIHKGRSL